MVRTEVEWDELLWDIKTRISRTKDIINGIHPPQKEIVHEEEKKPTAAEVISLLESQEPLVYRSFLETCTYYCLYILFRVYYSPNNRH